MGFWIFMLIMDLLLPFTMIGFGRYFMKKAPKEINSVFGYRTSMSMKNKDTWEFAHKYCGKVWYVCGMVMLPITVIFMLLVIGKNEDCVGSIGGIICGVQLIPLIGSILPTEIALKKNFDKNGTRRCFYTDDIDSVYKTLIENHVECLSEPQYFDFRADGFGESRAFYFRDPDGIILEMMQPL